MDILKSLRAIANKCQKYFKKIKADQQRFTT